jgi:exo-1,4-beta-D-glucosaminidase
MAWPDNKPTGVYSGGPYTWQDPKVYYSKAIAGKDWVFKDETGIPSQPPYNILPRIIPNLVWDKNAPFPMNDSWGYHDAATGNGRYDLYYKEMIKRLGEPASMEDFSNKMQLMNAVGYQGIFEAAGHKLNDIGGVMLWKLNAAFPSVFWQVYDWYMMPNAGYYFMQKACEPVHIQLNLASNKVTVVNRAYKSAVNLTAQADLYSLDSKSLFHESVNVGLSPSEVKETSSLSTVLTEAKGVTFVILNLKDGSGKVISRNTYWLSGNNDFKSLNEMPVTSVQAKIIRTEKMKNETRWTLQVTNTTSKLAFFIRPQVIIDGEEVLPSFWSDNFFTLVPSETTTVTVSCPMVKVNGKKPGIKISGWNVTEQVLAIN